MEEAPQCASGTRASGPRKSHPDSVDSGKANEAKGAEGLALGYRGAKTGTVPGQSFAGARTCLHALGTPWYRYSTRHQAANPHKEAKTGQRERGGEKKKKKKVCTKAAARGCMYLYCIVARTWK